MQDMGWLVYDL